MPEPPSLDGIQMKLARAEEHLDFLEAQVAAHNKRKLYSVADRPEQHNDWFIVRVSVAEEPDPRWGVIVGEFLHNTRTALDNLVWQLVLVNERTPSHKNQFPIFTKPAGRLGRRQERLNEMLRGVSAEHRAAIEELQGTSGSTSTGAQKSRSRCSRSSATLTSIDTCTLRLQ